MNIIQILLPASSLIWKEELGAEVKLCSIFHMISNIVSSP
jgi:hypothetical protein